MRREWRTFGRGWIREELRINEISMLPSGAHSESSHLLKIFRFITITFRQVLEELVTEGSGEVLTCLASKLREEKEGEVVGEEGKEYRLERTGKPVVSKLTHSESAPDIFFHEASKKMSGAPKGILRPPGSPRQRRPKSIFRLTSIPTEVVTMLIRESSRFGKNCLLQVWEIENCLAERELEREEEEERQEGCIGRYLGGNIESI